MPTDQHQPYRQQACVPVRKTNIGMSSYIRKTLPVAVAVLAAAQAAIVLLSWMVTSVNPASRLRSLLSGEGVRWLFGSFAENIACPLSAWLLLAAVAYGAFMSSGLKSAAASLRGAWRFRCAAWAAVVAAAVLVSLAVVLAAIPHAVLLGVDGSLYPSAFSAGIVPYAAASVTLISVLYGLISGTYASLEDVFRGMYAGVSFFAPLVPVYILAVEFYFSVRFVLAV